MARQEWTKGERRRITAVFEPKALSGDPSTPITVTIVDPDGTKVVDGNNATQGSDARTWYYDFTPQKEGDYLISFESDDGAKEIKEEYVGDDPTA